MLDPRKQQILEQLDEVNLSLLMDEYAEADGAALWREFQEAQASGSAEEIPAQLDTSCSRLIQKFFAKHSYYLSFRQVAKIVASIAACLLLVIGTFSVMVMSVDAIRLPVLNYLYERTDLASHILFTDENITTSPPSADDLISLLETFLPDEYQLDSKCDDANGTIGLGYAGNDDHYFSFGCTLAGGSYSFDTEDASVTEVKLGEYDAFFVEKDSYSLVWMDAETGFVYDIYAKGLDIGIFGDIAHALAQ